MVSLKTSMILLCIDAWKLMKKILREKKNDYIFALAKQPSPIAQLVRAVDC